MAHIYQFISLEEIFIRLIGMICSTSLENLRIVFLSIYLTGSHAVPVTIRCARNHKISASSTDILFLLRIFHSGSLLKVNFVQAVKAIDISDCVNIAAASIWRVQGVCSQLKCFFSPCRKDDMSVRIVDQLHINIEVIFRHTLSLEILACFGCTNIFRIPIREADHFV